MPIARISIASGRPPERIRAMAEKVTAAIAETLGAPPESIRVIVDEVLPEQWFAGGVSLADRARGDAGKSN